jgi:hypothetical protein
MKILSLVLVLTAFSRLAAAAPLETELSASELADIRNGQQVLHTEDVAGAVWPKIYVYQKVDASPEEVEAVIADYELSPSYMPDIISCKIVQKVDPTTTDVETLWRVIITTEDISLRYKLSTDATLSTSGLGYRTDWTLIKASTTKSIEGNTRLAPFEGGTLMGYYMFTVPGISLGGPIARQAVKQVVSSSQAFATQVENERKSNPALLNQQVAHLRAALGN